MREILFRGKTVRDGEWRYGAYSHHTSLNRGFIVNVGVDKVGPIAWTCEVDPKTVGQFTGLHDKNGERIFEGDIVEFDYPGVIRSVVFREDYAEFEFCSADQIDNVDGVCLCSDHDVCKVIGNIHDNPELLKGAN